MLHKFSKIGAVIASCLTLASCMETTGSPTSSAPSEIRLNFGGVYQPGNNCTPRVNGYENSNYQACLASALVFPLDGSNDGRYKYFVSTVTNSRGTAVSNQGEVRLDHIRRTSHPNTFYARARVVGREYDIWTAGRVTQEKRLTVDVVVSTTSSGLVNRIEFPNTGDINTIFGKFNGNERNSSGRIVYRVPNSRISQIAAAQNQANANTRGLILDAQIQRNQQAAREAEIARQNAAAIAAALGAGTGQTSSPRPTSSVPSARSTPTATQCMSTHRGETFVYVSNRCNYPIVAKLCYSTGGLGVNGRSNVAPCGGRESIAPLPFSGGEGLIQPNSGRHLAFENVPGSFRALACNASSQYRDSYGRLPSLYDLGGNSFRCGFQ